MKFVGIFRFEAGYQLRRVSTWLYFMILVVIAFLLIRENYIYDARNGDFLLNAPFVIAVVTALTSLMWLLVAAPVAGDAAVRDVRTRMYHLTYTTPVNKLEYLGARFLAAFALNALILLAVPVGIMLAVHLPGVEAEILAPFRLMAYITAYAFIALPNAFLGTAVQFLMATLNRKSVASYLGSLCLMGGAWVGGPIIMAAGGGFELAKLLDPIGPTIIIIELYKVWTPIERELRLVTLEGLFLLNRLLWFGIALGVFAITYFRFRFSNYTDSTLWRRLTGRKAIHFPVLKPTIKVGENFRIPIPKAKQTFGRVTQLYQMLTIAWRSFHTLSWRWLILPVIITIFTGLYMLGHMDFMGVPLLPRTDYVLTFLTAPLTDTRTGWVIVPLLTIFYAGELIWREREVGLGDLIDATPVPDWVLFFGRFLALCFVLVVWMALLIIAGVLVQTGLGYGELEIGRYLQILFGLQLTDYLLFALLTLLVHALASKKYFGYLMALIAYGFIAFASMVGIEHHLFVYGSAPRWSYTDMRGFGPFLEPWLWFKFYWVAWALLLAVIGKLFLIRGKERNLKVRFQIARLRRTPPMVRTTVVLAGLVLLLGGFIFYNTNLLNEYDTTSDRIERRAEYERRYKHFKNAPHPRLTGIRLHVEIYPEQYKMEIRGIYRLVNDGTVAIDSIHLATEVEPEKVYFDRSAMHVLEDKDLGYRIYALKEPLGPGDSLQLSFEVFFERHGFRNGGIDTPVMANGTFFWNYDWLPAIGYQSQNELRDAGDRKKYGLASRPILPSLYDIEARKDITRVEKTGFEAVVGTSKEQIAVAPGILRQEWLEGERRYFRYSVDTPIQNQYAIFSANYEVYEGQWSDSSADSEQIVRFQIFHHPEHTTNLDRLEQSIRASLDYYTKQFGPYWTNFFRLVEHPGHDLGMHAEAATIDYEEGFSLLDPKHNTKGLDLPFCVVAHEVAHQWWGIAQLVPARVEGAGLLIESLATYSAMQVVEETYGYEHLSWYLYQIRKAYEIPRSRATVPLIRSDNSFLNYRKGPLALYALSNYIGRDRVNGALRSFLEKHSSGVPPLPTSLDLYQEIQAVTPDSLRYLLHDLFETNTFWELKTEQVTAKQNETGSWQLTLDILVHKVVVDNAGVESDVPMNDWIEVGVFDTSGKNKSPLYLKKHRIRSGKQTITLTVPRKPVKAGIDPNYLLIDLKTEDNIKEVTFSTK